MKSYVFVILSEFFEIYIPDFLLKSQYERLGFFRGLKFSMETPPRECMPA